MLKTLNNYALVLLTASVAVSTSIHILGLDEKPWAKQVLRVCFDAAGLIRGFMQADQPK